MKIENAIVILQACIRKLPARHQIDFNDALKLGIEALKRVKDSRVQRLAGFTELLLGETILLGKTK